MKVYVLEWQGVYRQGIVGCYSSEELAREAASIAIMNENDDYHSLNLESYDLDQPYSVEEDSYEVDELTRRDYHIENGVRVNKPVLRWNSEIKYNNEVQ